MKRILIAAPIQDGFIGDSIGGIGAYVNTLIKILQDKYHLIVPIHRRRYASHREYYDSLKVEYRIYKSYEEYNNAVYDPAFWDADIIISVDFGWLAVSGDIKIDNVPILNGNIIRPMIVEVESDLGSRWRDAKLAVYHRLAKIHPKVAYIGDRPSVAKEMLLDKYQYLTLPLVEDYYESDNIKDWEIERLFYAGRLSKEKVSSDDIKRTRDFVDFYGYARKVYNVEEHYKNLIGSSYKGGYDRHTFYKTTAWKYPGFVRFSGWEGGINMQNVESMMAGIAPVLARPDDIPDRDYIYPIWIPLNWDNPQETIRKAMSISKSDRLAMRKYCISNFSVQANAPKLLDLIKSME